ncbi:MAG TPA: VOC family protein [Acidimicrobiales bacterium]|nr:VOC family protein [Acidimicrobiales bacterium]
MKPILHLSLPVADLVESQHFYVDVLGCDRGRQREGWMDVWFHGMQVTLHEQPDQVLTADQAGVRHFGVALSADEFDAIMARLGDHPVRWIRPVSTDHRGTSRQQTKATVADPSGNAIELKWYAEPAVGLEPPSDQPARTPTR